MVRGTWFTLNSVSRGDNYHILSRQVSGELFAHTSRFYPYNGVSNESDNSISKETLRDEVPVEFSPSNVVLQRLKERILRYIFLDQSFA